MTMQYVQSVKDFFRNPKWGMNMLLGGVSMLIPFIGQIILSGWIITQHWAQGGEKDPAKFPPFDFNHVEKYLMRGLWPFLAQLVAALVLGTVVGVVAVVLTFLLIAMIASLGDVAAVLGLLMLLVGFVIYIALIAGIQALLVPLTLKATLTQSFNEAFDFGFAFGFLKRVWKELIMSSLFLIVLMIAVLIISVPTLGFGMYFAMPVVLYSWQSLSKQLYHLHIERGGTEVALSEKLNDTPPTLPEPA